MKKINVQPTGLKLLTLYVLLLERTSDKIRVSPLATVEQLHMYTPFLNLMTVKQFS
jgi:hypothetical protein